MVNARARIKRPRGLMDEHLTERSFHRPHGLLDTDAPEPGARTGIPVRRPKFAGHSPEKVDRIMKVLRDHLELEEDARFGVRSRTSLTTHDVIRASRTASEAKRMGLLPEEAVGVNMEAVEANIHTLSKEEVDTLHSLSQGMALEEARPQPIPVKPVGSQPVEALKEAEERTGWSPGHGVKTFVRLFLHKEEKPLRRPKPSGI